jgi:hypothetical protein
MIFKTGDKVYDHAYGWGEVVRSTQEMSYYPVVAVFGKLSFTYTLEGSSIKDKASTLSFTEYTLEGFSQVRPKEPIPFNKGDVCYFSDHIQGGWATNIIVSINKDYEDKPFCSGANWRYLALENPLLNPETKIYTKEDL